MAKVVCNRWLLDFIDPKLRPPEESQLSIDANNVRALVNALDKQFPGIGANIQQGVVVAIDGEIFSDALLEPLVPDSEVYFLPPIEGG